MHGRAGRGGKAAKYHGIGSQIRKGLKLIRYLPCHNIRLLFFDDIEMPKGVFESFECGVNICGEGDGQGFKSDDASLDITGLTIQYVLFSTRCSVWVRC